MSRSYITHAGSGCLARQAGWRVIWFWLGALNLLSMPVLAIGPEQVAALPGATLLDMRVDAVFQTCGLPATIEDSADSKTKRQELRWGTTPMQLSAQAWTLRYSRVPVTKASAAWRHSQSGSVDCLAGLSALVVTTKGEAGFLTVKKRPDNNGYITTYTVPEDLFNAHQVVGMTGHWQQARTATEIRASYGEPDEVLETADGSRYRYWSVKRENKMPLSALAVDFDITGPAHACRTFAVHTTGVEFVQKKLDALIQQWERVYVLD